MLYTVSQKFGYVLYIYYVKYIEILQIIKNIFHYQ